MSGVGALRRCERHGQRAVLADGLGRGQHGAVGRVRLRGGRQIRRRLRERDPTLGVADEVVRVLGGDRDLQRARVGVADVLGGEDDHPPGHEERILTGLEHAHQPVDGGVGIARSHAFDERGDDVVVLLAALVVAERLLLQRLLDEGQVERLDAALTRARLAASSSAPSATRASPCERSARKRRASSARREVERTESALAVAERAVDQRGDGRVVERLEARARACATRAGR